jgi:hypothetical protein
MPDPTTPALTALDLRTRLVNDVLWGTAPANVGEWYDRLDAIIAAAVGDAPKVIEDLTAEIGHLRDELDAAQQPDPATPALTAHNCGCAEARMVVNCSCSCHRLATQQPDERVTALVEAAVTEAHRLLGENFYRVPDLITAVRAALTAQQPDERVARLVEESAQRQLDRVDAVMSELGHDWRKAHAPLNGRIASLRAALARPTAAGEDTGGRCSSDACWEGYHYIDRKWIPCPNATPPAAG